MVDLKVLNLKYDFTGEYFDYVYKSQKNLMSVDPVHKKMVP